MDLFLFARLLEAGADPSVEDADGYIAFDNARMVLDDMLETYDYNGEERAKMIEMVDALERFGRAGGPLLKEEVPKLRLWKKEKDLAELRRWIMQTRSGRRVAGLHIL